MKERIFFQIPFYAATQTIQLGLPVLIVPLLIRTLSPENYGVYEVGCVWALLANSALSLEIAQGLQRLHPEVAPEERGKLLASAVGYLVAIYGLFFLTSPLWARLMGEWAPYVAPFLLFGLANGLFAVIAVFARLEASAVRFAVTVGAYAAIYLGAHAAMLAFVHRGGVLTISNVLMIQSGALAAGCLLVGSSVVGRAKRIVRGRRRALTEMLRYSLPLSLSMIPVYLLGGAEISFVKAGAGVASTGLYSAAMKIAVVVNLFASATQAAIIPGIFGKREVGGTLGEDPAHPVLRAGLAAFELYAIPFLILILLGGREILGVVIPNLDESLIPVFGVLALALFVGKLVVFFPGIEIRKRTSVILSLQLALLAVGWVGYFFASRSGMLLHFAYVTLAVGVLRLAGFAFLSRRFIGSPFRAIDGLPVVLVLGALFAFAVLSSTPELRPVGARIGTGAAMLVLYAIAVRLSGRKLPEIFG